MALAGLSAVFLFEMLDNSILNVALPTIGRDLHASTTALQWVTGAYAVVFGGLMLAFGAVADRFGRRRIMLIGLVLLGVASLATAFVTTAEQLIAVRAVMGVAAAMTTPGSMALAFRLFDDGQPARPGDHPHLDRGSGRARDRPDGRRLRARGRAVAGPAAGERADRRARDHRRAVRHRRGRARPTCTATRSTSSARCWARRRSCSRCVAPTLFVERGHRLVGAVGGDRGGRRGGGPVRPARAFGAAPAARPRARRPPARLQRPGVQGRGRAGDRRPRLPGDAAAAARLGMAARTRRDRHAAAGRRPARGSARSSTRSCNGSASTGPPGSAPRRSCSGSPSTACSAASATSGSRSRSCSSPPGCAWSASSPGSTCSGSAEEPDLDRRGPGRHRHRGRLRRRHRRHRHHPRGAVHRRHRHLELERPADRGVPAGGHDRAVSRSPWWQGHASCSGLFEPNALPMTRAANHIPLPPSNDFRPPTSAGCGWSRRSVIDNLIRFG